METAGHITAMSFLGEFQKKLESEDRCKDCNWCDEVLTEYKQA